MLRDIGLVAFELERLAFRLVLVVMIVGLTRTLVTWLRLKPVKRGAGLADEAWPKVTVQIPLRNEFYVADRVIRAVSRFDYPKDRLEVQVLDDSDDDTKIIVDATVDDVRAETGLQITVVRRPVPKGYKAGHLALGLESAKGEFVAIFDADFVPPRDFLTIAIPILVADDKIGLVQGRWEFLNGTASLLTRIQALVLYGLMLIEQPAKSRSGKPFQFNGTAGVWRRACIDDAGGWSGASVVEDLDLSYRAIMKGWRFIHLPDLAVPTELPETMMAYRAQQRRWTRGNAQMLRALGLKVLLDGNLSITQRISMLMHLGGRVLYVLLACLTVSMPLTTFEVIKPIVNYSVLQDGAVLAFVVIAFLAFYVPARQAAGGSRWGAALTVGPMLAFHIGMSFCCTTAFLSGLYGREAVFVRTPKSGGTEAKLRGPRYRPPLDIVCVLELVIGVAYVGFTVLAASKGYLATAAFFALITVSYLWVGATSLFGWAESISGAEASRRRAGELAQRLLVARGRTAPPPADDDQARQSMLEQLRGEVARARRNGRKVAFLVIQSRISSLAQMATLLEIGAAMRGSLRPYDSMIAQPNEITVVLPDASAEDGRKLLGRFSQHLGSGDLSIGVADGPDGADDTPEEIYARASSNIEVWSRGTQ